MLFELDFETSYKEFDLADCRCHIHKFNIKLSMRILQIYSD